jgi:hypothetical protein
MRDVKVRIHLAQPEKHVPPKEVDGDDFIRSCEVSLCQTSCTPITMTYPKVTTLFAFALLPSASAFIPSQNALLRVPHAPQSISPRSISMASPKNFKVKPSFMAVAVEEEADKIPEGTATVTELIFNLVKGIVGAGVLSLPAGIAAWANSPSAVLPAVALIAGIGSLSAYGFALIGRCCAYTNTKSYRDAWSATVGKSTSWIPAVAVTLKTIAAILAYSMILGDTFVSLLTTAGITASKTPVLIALTSTILLPLCLLKNLSALAPFSLVGSLGMIYTAVAMIIRYLGKAYTKTGAFGMDCAPALRPAFGSVGAEGILTPSAAILVGMLSTAYMVRYIPFQLQYAEHNELKNSSTVLGPLQCSQGMFF